MHKTSPLTFLILFLTVIVALSDSRVLAEPNDESAAKAWIIHVRSIHNWPSDFDVRADASRRETRARWWINIFPSSRKLKRYLADALHVLGHFAEYDHDYARALQYHEESLKLFLESDLGSHYFRGEHIVFHVRLHIFVDLLEQALLSQRAGQSTEAHQILRKAFSWYDTSHLSHDSYIYHNDLAQERIDSLDRRWRDQNKLRETNCNLTQSN